MFAKDSFKIKSGEDSLTTTQTSPAIKRHSCKHCGSSTFNELDWPNGISMVNSFSGLFKDPTTLPPGLTPGLHIYYGDRVMDFHDDVVKYQDTSKEYGGTGVLLTNEGEIIDS